MIKYNHIFATSIVALCGVVGCNAYAAQNAPMVMSKYGEIQSVNKYSSNPFWTPNSPYNQRFPTPIYVTGPDLTSGDCNRIVQNLVSEYCTNRGNCSNLRIADVRPVVMVQLSQLPGHNFATSCGGYIDSVFENYKKTYGNVSTNNIVKPVQQKQNTIQIENPFKQTKTDYEIATDERTAELERMQRVTTAAATITPANFPKTVDDLSFTDRLANTTAGYEPYKNLNAYQTPKFETEDEYYERMKSVLTHTINYIGAGAKGCPPTYLTGRGATVSCTPTRQNGTCTAWCTDAALTDCKTSLTISPNDRDDKTFYGKCTCNPGYEENGYKCVKLGTQNTGGYDDTGTTGNTDGSFGGGQSSGNSGHSGRWDDDVVVVDNDGTGTFALLQCRSETIPNYGMLGDGKGNMSDPFTELGCVDDTRKSITNCFTRCRANYDNDKSPGFINKTLDGIIPNKFCSGYFTWAPAFAEPVGFFSYAKNPRMLATMDSLKVMTFDSAQIAAIKNAINGLSIDDRKDYCDTKHQYWLIYILEQNSNGTWKVADKPLILYHDK